MKNWLKICLVCCVFILTSWSFVACTNTANASDEGDKDTNNDVSTESPVIPEEPDETPAHQHSYGTWYVTIPATCTQNGTERRDCTDVVCEFYETRTVDALGHQYQTSTIPARVMALMGSPNTATPISAATTGSRLAMMDAFPASTRARPHV